MKRYGKKVQMEQSKRKFKFAGDGKAKTSLTARIPIAIKGREGLLVSSEIGENTPLLLSVGALKALGMHLDLDESENTVTFKKLGVTVPLIVTKSGHLGIKIDEFIERGFTNKILEFAAQKDLEDAETKSEKEDIYVFMTEAVTRSVDQ